MLKEILEGEMLVLFVSVRVEGDTGRRDVRAVCVSVRVEGDTGRRDGDAEGLAHVSAALLDRADCL